jgi:uncharacterized membrane protein
MSPETALLILFVAALSTLPIFFIKLQYKTKQDFYFILAVIAGALLSFAYVPITKLSNLAVAFALINIVSTIMVVLYSMVFTPEHITGLYWIGLILGIISTIILSNGV